MINTAAATKPMELDASELTFDEWFFVWAAMGQHPEAKLKDIMEWRKRALGMSRLQQAATIRAGMESLIARGFIKPELDSNGNHVRDAKGELVYRPGNIVSRITAVQPIKTN